MHIIDKLHQNFQLKFNKQVENTTCMRACARIERASERESSLEANSLVPTLKIELFIV